MLGILRVGEVEDDGDEHDDDRLRLDREFNKLRSVSGWADAAVSRQQPPPPGSGVHDRDALHPRRPTPA